MSKIRTEREFNEESNAFEPVYYTTVFDAVFDSQGNSLTAILANLAAGQNVDGGGASTIYAPSLLIDAGTADS